MSIDASVRLRWLQAGVAIGVVVIAVALILPAVERSREVSRRSQSKNNLKQIALALDTYHDAYNMLPYGGIFDDQGTPFHGWMTALGPYLAAIPYYEFLDPKFPWDDPVNLERALRQFAMPFQNPSVAERTSADGLPLAHYAANQRLFYRNSVVSLSDVEEKSATALVGDCNGNFIPIGYPFHWRDLSAGIAKTPDAFGCPTRDITMLIMADGSGRLLNNRTDAAVVQTLAGPESLEPSPDQVAKPNVPYRLNTREYWRYLNINPDHRRLIALRRAPDGKYLEATFENYEFRDLDPKRLSSQLQEFIKLATVEHVELKGKLRADEVRPFLEIPTVNRLTISGADITGDKDAVLAAARKEIVVD